MDEKEIRKALDGLLQSQGLAVLATIVHGQPHSWLSWVGEIGY
jgi:hypothetical protein